MSVTINLPNVLTKHASGRSTIEAAGATVGEVVDGVAALYPDLAQRLRSPTGDLYEFVTIYLNADDIRFLGGFDAAVAPGDHLTVVPAVAGG